MSITLYAWDVNGKYNDFSLSKKSECIICNEKTVKNHNDCNRNKCRIIRDSVFNQLVTSCSICVKCKDQFNLDKNSRL